MPPVSFWTFAQAHPDQLAVVEPDGNQVSAGALLAAANRLVHGLRALGLRRGDVAAMALPNGAAALELFMACAQAGFYLTPINWHLTAAEIAYILEDCGAK